MKKILSMLLMAAMLTGCANMTNPLDSQGASKGTKTAEAAGFGAIVGGIAGKMLGVDSRFTAVIGAFVGGISEWNHETAKELKAAQAEAEKLKAANIESDVKQAKVEVKDQSGSTHSTTQLTSYSVHATNEAAAKSVATVIGESAFAGQVVIVAKPSQKREIEAGLKDAVDAKAKAGKPVKIAFYDRKEVESAGIKPGIAWVPQHPTALADNGKKGGAA